MQLCGMFGKRCTHFLGWALYAVPDDICDVCSYLFTYVSMHYMFTHIYIYIYNIVARLSQSYIN